MVIGLDLGDGGLLREWTREGRLPSFARLIDQGVTLELGTTAEWLHVSAWPSLYTGAPPGVHGVYYTFQPAPGLQGYRRFSAGQYGVPTLWRLLGDAGIRCTVFDAPYTHPEPGPNLTQVIDWGTWAHYIQPVSTPASLLRRLWRRCGRYPVGLEAHDLGLAGMDGATIQPRLLDGVRAKTNAILWLMREQPWECFVTVYGETHPGAHYCWRPSADAGASALSLLRELYEEIDRGVGRILEALPADANVFVVSGDRIGPNHSGWHLLPDVLRRLDLLCEPAAQSEAGSGEQRQGAVSGGAASKGWDPIRTLRDLLPKDFRKSLARRLPTKLRDRLARRVDMGAIDWSRTRAFTLPTDLEGCVRINRAGREPFGIVQPGSDYEQLCGQITDALMELVNPETGRPAVREVVRSDRRFPGPRRDYLPDLIVLWNAEAPIVRLESPRIGTVSGASPDGRTGTHASPGFMIMTGPGVDSTMDRGSADVRDLAPAILSLYGVKQPDYMKESGAVAGRHDMNETGDAG